jgi:hypothetical protein
LSYAKAFLEREREREREREGEREKRKEKTLNQAKHKIPISNSVFPGRQGNDLNPYDYTTRGHTNL